ncbi:unnamed protein product, partial [Phaeothamnion confervicola]
CGRRGELPAAHLVDHPALAAAAAAALPAGARLTGLLVLYVPPRATGRIRLTRKPLLLAAATGSGGGGKAAEEGSSSDNVINIGWLPASAAELTAGDVVVGAVSRVDDFGVFVRFRNNLTALCPRALVADQFVPDVRGLFAEHDSVRAVVQRVDAEAGRVVLTFKSSLVPSCGALFLSTLLAEEAAAAKEAATATTAVAAGKDASPADLARRMPDWQRYPIGTTTNATVTAVRDYGLVLMATDGQTLIVCPPSAASAASDDGAVTAAAPLPAVGDAVKVRVLSVDFEKRVLNATAEPAFVGAGRRKRRRERAPLEAFAETDAEVLIAGTDMPYAVVAAGDDVALVQVADYHCPYRRAAATAAAATAGLAATVVGRGAGLKEGSHVTAVVTGHGPDGGPFAGVPLLTLPGEGSARSAALAAAREEREARKTKKATAALAAAEAAAAGLDKPAKGGGAGGGNSGKRPVRPHLKPCPEALLKPGRDVWCMVQAVNLERIEAVVLVDPMKGSALAVTATAEKAAAKAKAKTRRLRRRKASMESDASSVMGTLEEDGVGDDGDSDDDAAAAAAADGKVRKGKGVLATARAIVHVTDAPPADVSAPAPASVAAQQQAKQGTAAAAVVPQWHPFGKMSKGDVLKARILMVGTSFDGEGHKENKRGGKRRDRSASADDAADGGGGDGKEGGSRIFLRLSIVPEVVALPRGELPAGRPQWEDATSMEVGDIHRGVVHKAVEGGVWIDVAPGVRGFAPLLELSDDPAMLASPPATHFPAGSAVPVILLAVDTERRQLDVSPRAAIAALAAHGGG